MGSNTSAKYNVQHGKGALNKQAIAESVVFTHVVGCWDGKWLRFDNLAIAKQVMPLDQHHLIYIDYADLQARFPGGTKALWELGRKFGSKDGKQLWASLLMQAYDPQARYDEIIETQQHVKKTRGRPAGTKRYRRKLSYLFVYDEHNDAHIQGYAKLPPQACAVLDVLTSAMYDRSSRVFTEGELQELLETRKEMLHTKQSSWRIWQYYRGTLINKGFIRFAKEGDK